MKPEMVTSIQPVTPPRAGGGEGPVVPMPRQAPAAGGNRPPPGPGDLEKAVSEINDYVQTLNRSLQFSVDDDSGRTVIKVIDPQSDEVIRQIPPEEILAIARVLQEQVKGALFEELA